MPTSYLTRVIFRQLLAGHGLRHAGCTAPSWHGIRIKQTVRAQRMTQRRSFFFGSDLLKGKKQGATEAMLDPGMDKLLEHSKRSRLSARLNPVPEVAGALQRFFSNKHKYGRQVQDQEVAAVLAGYKYVRANQEASDDRFLQLALSVLGFTRHVEAPLGKKERRLFHELIMTLAIDLWHHTAKWKKVMISIPHVPLCIRALGRVGLANEAKQICFSNSLADVDFTIVAEYDLEKLSVIGLPLHTSVQERLANIAIVLRAYKAEGDLASMTALLKEATNTGLEPEASQVITMTMAEVYAQSNDLEEARRWYNFQDKQFADGAKRPILDRDPAPYECLLKACITKGDQVFGAKIIQDIMLGSNRNKLRDFSLVWAAGCGKGVEEIDRMMSSMEQARIGYKSTISTINSLISFALWKKNAYLAERFFQMGVQRGIQANAHTFILQMEYRLRENDVDGALTAFTQMQSQTIPKGDEAAGAVNKLLCAMCKTKRHDFDSIMNVAGDLSSWHARFGAETVSTLAVLHMTRAEPEEAEDLIFTHAFQFSIQERQLVLRSLIDFCKQEETSNDIAWSTYELLQKAFDDMQREQRTELMEEFLRRRQGALAVVVFEHMRLHSREDTIPLLETYVAGFVGLARHNAHDAFGSLYNMLKLDTLFEPTTRLHNAVMLACVACGMPARALTHWDSIVVSPEGPDLDSVCLAYRACAFTPGGDDRARHIHKRLVAAGVQMDEVYYSWLFGALGGHGHVSEAVSLMVEVQQEKGLAPTLLMIGNLANNLLSMDDQAQLLRWTRGHAPKVFEQLERQKVQTDHFGRRRYSLESA